MNKKGVNQRSGLSRGVSIDNEWQMRGLHVDGAPNPKVTLQQPLTLLLTLPRPRTNTNTKEEKRRDVGNARNLPWGSYH